MLLGQHVIHRTAVCAVEEHANEPCLRRCCQGDREEIPEDLLAERHLNQGWDQRCAGIDSQRCAPCPSLEGDDRKPAGKIFAGNAFAHRADAPRHAASWQQRRGEARKKPRLPRASYFFSTLATFNLMMVAAFLPYHRQLTVQRFHRWSSWIHNHNNDSCAISATRPKPSCGR